MRVLLPILILVLFSSFLIGQSDTTTLYLNNFIDRVSEHHPMTYQAGLLSENANAVKMQAKGAFDPKLAGDFDNKSYDDKNYYRNLDAGLKIPTWFGADFKAGYERNDGEFLNNSDNLPPQGIWSAGISIPLGKGLIIDDRRAEVKKANIFIKATVQEQSMMINELIFNAHRAYLDWQFANEIYRVEKQGLDIAVIRFNNTKISHVQGDIPAIDTLESLITVQDRRQRLQAAQQDVENKKIFLQNFLWVEGFTPLEIDELVVPEPLEIDLFTLQMDSLILVKDQAINTIPAIMLYNFKLESLEVDNRLNRENLKPELNLEFSPLIGSTNNNAFSTYDVNDYKLGASFSMPLFLRKERAKLEMTKIKIEQTNADLALKRQELSLKLDIYENNEELIGDQLFVLEENQDRYLALLNAENRKFQIGESSIFLINSREIKYLESLIKVADYKTKLIKTRLFYLFLMNQFAL